MGLASYEIVGGSGEWAVRHDGRIENVYQTKESAFEAAVAAASLAMRQGHEVRTLRTGERHRDRSGPGGVALFGDRGARVLRNRPGTDFQPTFIPEGTI